MSEVFTADDCLEHDVPFGFPERRQRLTGILARLDTTRELHRVSPHRLTGEMIAAVHDVDYLALFERAVERGDGLFCSADNPLSAGTLRAARAAVDAVLSTVDRMMEAPASKPFAAVRPPGHHAERAMAMGFCYFNNVAIAAQALLSHHGLERVAIFDFDVHHGNGTQHLFEDRADVFYLSIHQWPFYPGTGAESERGSGPGEGATRNFCLAAGSGDDLYRRVMEEGVLPSIEAFAPQALLISAGFDAWRGDPVGGMRVSEAGFAEWGATLRDLADRSCAGRMLSTLEGGYDLAALPDLVESYLG